MCELIVMATTCTVAEEVGHGHVTYVRKRSLYGGFGTEKTIRIFSVPFSITSKELVSFESASGVEYPVNPVQPLGHFGCRAA